MAHSRRERHFGSKQQNVLDVEELKQRMLGEEQDDRTVGGRRVPHSPRIHQEYTFRHRSACRTPAESGQEYLATGKAYIKPCKTQQDEGTRGKNRSVSRPGPALGRSPIPTSGQVSESEEEQ